METALTVSLFQCLLPHTPLNGLGPTREEKSLPSPNSHQSEEKEVMRRGCEWWSEVIIYRRIHDHSPQVPAQEQSPVLLILNVRNMCLCLPGPRACITFHPVAGKKSTFLDFTYMNCPMSRAREHQPGHGMRLLWDQARKARVSVGHGQVQM